MKKNKMFLRSKIALLLAAALVFTGCSSKSSGGDSVNTGPPPPVAGSHTNGSAADSAPESSYPADSAYASAPQTAPNYDDSASSSHIGGEPYPVQDEEYLAIAQNGQRDVADNPLLTFSLKVDTASYRNIARYLSNRMLPPSDAVRIEEMVNYFSYDEPTRESGAPFSIYTEVGPSPFDANRELAFVRVKSKDVDRFELPDSNLVFLIDTSGSMNSYDKLPLLKQSFALLTENLTKNDRVSIVTYAGNAGVLLDSVAGNQKQRIIKAIDSLQAGGSTGGADGINTAYRLAEKNFNKNMNNRVILATDGDFNVGVSSVAELERLISQKRETGVYLSVLGFGAGNLKDNKMETLAKNGNGNYSYIDSVRTAQKVLVDELGANLFTIADDVKAQIEFNPAQVSSYRLIGYENSMLADRDFNDDTKDAGEIGVGTDVALMFEITRASGSALKYQPDAAAPNSAEAYSDELFEVKIRYKNPGEANSNLIAEPVKTSKYTDFNTNDFNFAASVASFGHLLKNSPYKGGVTSAAVRARALDSLGRDAEGYRAEFIEILDNYIAIGER